MRGRGGSPESPQALPWAPPVAAAVAAAVAAVAAAEGAAGVVAVRYQLGQQQAHCLEVAVGALTGAVGAGAVAEAAKG